MVIFVIATYIVLLFLYLIIRQRSRLVLYKGEREELYKLCIEYKIPILYPRLFKSDEPHHYLWGFNKNGIALVGTIIMRSLSKNRRVLHGIKELESFLKKKLIFLNK